MDLNTDYVERPAKKVYRSTKINHKDREYGTIIFAAPVEINGIRCNVAVVVKETNKNYYKVHRVAIPEGKKIEFTNKKSSTASRRGSHCKQLSCHANQYCFYK